MISESDAREQAGIDMMHDVRELLEKHGTQAVLGALQQFADCLADHMRETSRPYMAEHLTKAVKALAVVTVNIACAELECGITLADAAEVFIA